MPAEGGDPEISFVVPVRNGGPLLARCLDSIRRVAAGASAEIIVADHNSSDDSASVARAAGARVIVVRDKTVSGVRNLAAAAAGGRLLAFVDADHELAQGWLQAALELLQDRSVAAVGNQYAAPPDGTWVQQTYDLLRRHRAGTRRVDWLPTGNLVVRRAAFDEAGGFDESLVTCEDVDLCRRLTSKGGGILASDRLRSVHHGDPRTLGALFRGELWRGRDSLRVSLREPLSVASLRGLVLPGLMLTAWAATLAGLLTGAMVGPAGWAIAGAGIALGVLLIAVRAAVLTRSHPSPNLTVVVRAAIFAAVFDTARAFALVLPVGHGLRRDGRAGR